MYIKDLLKRKPDTPGAKILEDNLIDICIRWKDLQEKCKERANLLDELKDFHDILDKLNNGLNLKGKLMNILGPIASDPRLVQDQTSQIWATKEKFVGNQSNKDRFNDVGKTVSDIAGSSLDIRRVIRRQLEKLSLVNNLKDVEHLQGLEHQYHFLLDLH